MSKLVFELSAISDLALQITQSVLAKEEEAKKIMADDAGPLHLASALSDYFEIAAAVEAGTCQLEMDELSEFGFYGLDLLDRLAYLVRQLEIMDQRDNVTRMFPSFALWLARRDAILDNLEGAADGFGMLVNGLNDAKELGEMCKLMDEVIEAASARLRMDEDRTNTWRPWRVINLNSGIAATRSLDAELMEQIFEKLGRRLPYDMPGFFADGKRQMMVQNVPDDVKAVMDRYIEKWPNTAYH